MIQYIEKDKLFMIHTMTSTYAFCICENITHHLYYGARINDVCDLPTIDENIKCFLRNTSKSDFQEYRAYGGESYIDADLKVRFADGTRTCFLEYCSHEIQDNILQVFLKDKLYPIEVVITYVVREEFDIIERSAKIINHGEDDIILENVFSATLMLPRRDEYRLTYFSGGWAREYKRNEETIKDTKRVMETRTGLSGPEAIPFFMIDERGEATEEHGDLYFGTIIWSGNWKMIVDRDKFGRIIITGGVNDFDFEWCLEKGESFETPKFAFGYTYGGFGHVSRNLHDYERNIIMQKADSIRIIPVICNAYGTFFAQINEERILGFIDSAKDIGIELLIIDAGWQGEGDIGSPDYAKGMGIWSVNKTRFPNGLKIIADKIHENGMMFGLWMEPENIHSESELYKIHPEWVMEYHDRDISESRNRYTLNFGMDDVCEYITEKICSLIQDYEVDYFKIDFNKFINQVGWKAAEQKHQKEAWVRYTQNISKCYSEVKRRYPNIIFENCASGGMRVDLGMLAFSGRINRSDNQDTLDMIKIHEGYSHFMIPKLAGGGCHISSVYSAYYNDRHTPLEYQAHAAMLGSMAVGEDLRSLSSDKRESLRKYIKEYKEIRHIVHLGDFYRLVTLREKHYGAYEYVTKDRSEAVIIILGHSMQFCEIPERLRILGLDENAKYEIEGYGVYTGCGLKTIGLQFYLDGDFKSKIIKIKRV